MAKPQQSYPTTATLGEHADATDHEGRAALEQALSEHGDELAAVVRSSDELDDALTTAILVAASADEDEVQHVTDSAANLVEAAEGLSTDGAAALATELGENADELSDSLETVVDLQREGHVDDLATVATALTESLSPEEIEELATMLEESGEALVETAGTLSALDLDDEAVDGVNSLLDALGQAQRKSEPRGVLGTISALQSADVRAGLGYLVSVLQALGRSVRHR